MSWTCACGNLNVVDGYDCLRCGADQPQPDPEEVKPDEPYRYVPPVKAPSRIPTTPFKIAAVAVVCLVVILGTSGGLLYMSKSGPFETTCERDAGADIPEGAPVDLRSLLAPPRGRGAELSGVLTDDKAVLVFSGYGKSTVADDVRLRKSQWRTLLRNANFQLGAFHRRPTGFSYVLQFSSHSCAQKFHSEMVPELSAHIPTTSFTSPLPQSLGLELSYSARVPSTFLVATVVDERLLLVGEASGTGNDASAKDFALLVAGVQHRVNSDA